MSSFLDLFSKKTNRAVGIDIGSSSIKVVELHKRGDVVELLTYGLLETGPYGGREIGRVPVLTPEKTAEALSDVLREARVGTIDAGIAIPFRSSFMKLIDLPQVTEKELKKMVPLEARKYVPVPIDEVALDWALVPQVTPMLPQTDSIERQMVHVFLIAIHNDILSRFQKISQDAGLKNHFFEVEAYSTMRSVLSHSNEAVLMCDIGATSTKIYITYKGFVLVTHVINAGSQDMTLDLSKSFGITIAEAEVMKREKGLSGGPQSDTSKVFDMTLQKIASEINRAKENFETKFKTTITKVTLVGGGSQLKDLPAFIEGAVAIETEKGNAFGGVETPALLSETIAEIGPEFAVAMGCALRAISNE